uniref:ZSWIM3 N-terminal domain-containing protein n=1 Tax=Biomphalaria glabrata TaxID=6526 RepID=A0A2C9L4P3_BIOGL
MSLRMEPGQMYNSWAEFKDALDSHCREHKVLFNISNAKTVEQANNMLKKKPYFDINLKYASIILVCKHYGSYKSLSSGLRPKQRSYKINCKAYISVSACRKENYLIIRDSYHIHSHPCTEEIYNSYPEVRRMTKEERKMVGTLMELGVPTSQIKNAVGRHVTHKDLQNAKTHIKAVKMGVKREDQSNGQRRRKTFKELHDEKDGTGLEDGEALSESDEDKLHESTSLSSTQSIQNTAKDQTDEDMSRDATNSGYTITVGEMDSLSDARDSLGMVEISGNCEKDLGNSEMGGLTGLLAAAGLSSDSVVLTVNSQGHTENNGIVEAKNSYTVTVSLPEGDVTQTGTNLQELLKGLPLGKVVPKPLSLPESPVKVKMEDVGSPEVKGCIKCGGYISPLDGHEQCLSCLGPEHIHEVNCEHCLAMSQEQFNIRRKKMVALRMKALKEMRRKRKNDTEQHDSDSDYSPVVRKSKRPRKPVNFGPDIYVDETFLFGGNNDSKAVKRNDINSSKLYAEESRDMDCIPKIEPLDEESTHFCHESNDFNPFEQYHTVPSHNSQRFDHILSQAKVFEDVTLMESGEGSLRFSPSTSICSEFQKSIAIPDLPPFPPTVMGKYILHSKFEQAFCSELPPLLGVTDPTVDVMGKGLAKLAKNAAVQTRLAVYDKLFTRVGVGMADEALSIISELYGKVTEVTEISQEDLTSSLQTALDTIQALKDVLEELGVMSKDAISTASHQRSISFNALQAARKTLIPHRIPNDETSHRRSKFQPFSKAKVTTTKSSTELSSLNKSTSYRGADFSSPMSPAFKLKELAERISAGQANSNIHVSGLPMVTLATSQDGLDVNPEISTAFIMSGKEFTVGPLNGDLLHSISTSNEGIIELHVMKNSEDLIDAEEAAVEEVIQTD